MNLLWRWFCNKCHAYIEDDKVNWRFRGHEVEPTDKAIPSCPKCCGELEHKEN